MKRLFSMMLAVCLLVASIAFPQAQNPKEAEKEAHSKSEARSKKDQRQEKRGSTAKVDKPPARSQSGGHFEKGGADIGKGVGHGSKEMGKGAGSFGKSVGKGVAQGFKNFGKGFRGIWKKI